MLGNRFSKFEEKPQSVFDTLFELLQELLVYTSGDVAEALDWLNQLDRQYQITTPEYGMGDFIQELKDRGFLKEDDPESGVMQITAKMEQSIRKNSLDQIFGKLKKGPNGNHQTHFTGKNGEELGNELRAYEFGDAPQSISMIESIKQAQINNGIENFNLTISSSLDVNI